MCVCVRRLDGVMKEDSKVMDIIVEELTEAKNKHAVPRRTVIKPDEGEESFFAIAPPPSKPAIIFTERFMAFGDEERDFEKKSKYTRKMKSPPWETPGSGVQCLYDS